MNLVCMLVYQMGIQIYDQITNFNKLVKSETRRPVSLGFGLKEAEITLNMAKVGIHSSTKWASKSMIKF